MRSLAFVCLLALAAGAVACGGTRVNLPPVAPEEVEVYFQPNLPTEKFEVLARIAERAPQETTDQSMVDRAKAAAAEMGADALIIDTIRTTTEGQVELDLNVPREKIIEARAIYFPARHPELMSESGY